MPKRMAEKSAIVPTNRPISSPASSHASDGELITPPSLDREDPLPSCFSTEADTTSTFDVVAVVVTSTSHQRFAHLRKKGFPVDRHTKVHANKVRMRVYSLRHKILEEGNHLQRLLFTVVSSETAQLAHAWILDGEGQSYPFARRTVNSDVGGLYYCTGMMSTSFTCRRWPTPTYDASGTLRTPLLGYYECQGGESQSAYALKQLEHVGFSCSSLWSPVTKFVS